MSTIRPRDPARTRVTFARQAISSSPSATPHGRSPNSWRFCARLDVTLLVDVRSIPRSRITPQFNKERLPDALAAEGIGGRAHHGLGQVVPAPLTPGAHVLAGGTLRYPAAADQGVSAGGD